MKNQIALITVVILLTCQFINGQDATEIPQELQLTEKDSIVVSSWNFGLGFNAIDDAGSEFSNVFNFSDNWNAVPHPSRLSIGKYFKSGLGLEFIGAYNKYFDGKTVDGVVLTEDIDYMSADVRVSYDLNKILGETGFFDPYVGVGVGYTDANNQGRGTYNASVGFRTWLSDNWGLDFNSSGKWTMDATSSTNHIQHAAGVVYRFGIEKGLSPKGEEKLSKLREFEEEFQRQQDSIAEARRAEEEARLLEERLRREEQERLAAEQKAKEDAENARRSKIENAINGLGYVYFDLNSSYLTTESKSLLDELIEILNNNPGVVIRVESHTDSRGADKYNQWLSERRVNRTRDYLLSKGVEESRIEAQGFGEDQLTNECEDNIYCPEEKHRENRRSEFKILKF